MQQQVAEERSQGPEEFLENEEIWYPDEELETLHVYLVPEKKKKSFSENTKQAFMTVVWIMVVLAWIAGMTGVILSSPLISAYTITTMRVPAHFTLKVLQANVSIIPTGKHSYPATHATGVLTIYNGSFLTQQLPASFILTTSSGIEVLTDQAVTIPSASPPALGSATVRAHAAASGIKGNIGAYAIDQTYGTALYIKNLEAFTGGQDAYTTTYATSQNVQTAREAARAQLTAKQPAGLTTGPCSEKARQQALTLVLVWSCAYVSYTPPKGVQVLAVRVQGAMVVLVVQEAAQPSRKGQPWR